MRRSRRRSSASSACEARHGEPQLTTFVAPEGHSFPFGAAGRAMMHYTTLKIERRGAAAWVWMSRPEVHNAFDETLIAELTDAFRRLDADPAVRAIVLAGEGKSF